MFLLFCNYLPYEKDRALHLNKLESTSHKDALCQVWLKLALWFWRKRFLNFINVFSLIRNYLPLEKGKALHLKLWIPFTQVCFVPSLDDIGPVVLEKMKMWKFTTTLTTTTTTTTENWKILIREAHLSLRLRWANKKLHMTVKISWINWKGYGKV